MLPESSIQGHLFIKVRNCSLNPFIAANVTQAVVMDSESLHRLGMSMLGSGTGGCRRCLGLPGFSWGAVQWALALVGQVLASPKLKPEQLFQSSSFSP